MKSNRQNIIVELMFQITIQIVKLCELSEEYKEFEIARQLVKNGV